MNRIWHGRIWMKARYFWTMAGLLLGIIVIGAALPQEVSAKTFSNASLSGGYSGEFSGLNWFTPTGGSSYKLDITEIVFIQFDGLGSFTGDVTFVAAVTFG